MAALEKPTKVDAIFGVGGAVNKDRVGSLYHHLISQRCEEYQTLRNTEKGDFVYEEIIRPIEENGGKFLQGLPNGEFERIEDVEVISRKIKQALRDRMKTKKYEPLCDPRKTKTHEHDTLKTKKDEPFCDRKKPRIYERDRRKTKTDEPLPMPGSLLLTLQEKISSAEQHEAALKDEQVHLFEQLEEIGRRRHQQPNYREDYV